MKARVKETYYTRSFTEGEIVEIVPNMDADAADVFNVPAGRCFLCKKEDGTLRYIIATNLEILPEEIADPDYWTRLEHQYAGMAMQGILAKYGVEPLPDDAAHDAYNYAHALVEMMKEVK